MANEGNLICGLIPQPGASGYVDARFRVPVNTAGETGLFRGTPYFIDAGLVTSVNVPGGLPIAGCIIKLYDSTGDREVTNLPVGTAGFADVTYRLDQRYHIVINGSQFADDGSDNGLTYNFTGETSVASANGFDGASNSSVQLDGSSEDPSSGHFIASQKVNKPRNIGDAVGTLIEGHMNPSLWQAW